MKRLRMLLALWIGKAAIKICRLFNWGGTALPGKLSAKICPYILQELSEGINIILVTGTNGKTTTTRMICRILKENSIPYITNKSGANLVVGIISTFIESVDWLGKSAVETAVLEVDEAAIQPLTAMITPRVLVVTNFFPDQLDRFGEMYATLKSVRVAVSRSRDASLVLNADDALCASLGNVADNKVFYYGLSEAPEVNGEAGSHDSLFCLFCKSKLEYDFHVYGHLGGYHCPSCGYTRPEPSICAAKISELTTTSTNLKLKIEDKEYDASVNLPGLYNVYNALAAAGCGQALGLPAENTLKALSSFQAGFGRMENIDAEGRNLKVILVKNSTGFNQVLSYILTEDKPTSIAFIINDHFGDGTDISWLWDVDFEKLKTMKEKIKLFLTSGTRGEDMAVRLKYADIPVERIETVQNQADLLDRLLSQVDEGYNVYLLPTYTAMMEIRQVLAKRYHIKRFWE